MAKKKPEIVGRWRITSMTEWDQDFVDEEVPGYFEFRKDGLGEFQFGYVQGQTDWRDADREGRPAVEFTFEGIGICSIASRADSGPSNPSVSAAS